MLAKGAVRRPNLLMYVMSSSCTGGKRMPPGLAIQARRKVGLCKGLASAADARLRSKITTSCPARVSSRAAASPASPAPTTTTCLRLLVSGSPFLAVSVYSLFSALERLGRMCCALWSFHSLSRRYT